MIPTQDQVRHVAKLSRLHLTEEEVILYQSQLSDIFGYIDKLSEIDVSHISETKHASRYQMNLRPDVINMMDDPEKLIAVTEQEVIGNHVAITNIMKRR
ncbi:MAG: Asp-tRNA(Asn)/Glu-tRNA(Gln) amidotransferase subunit GatC [Candidatus Gracilibacteria bacterium]|jgi:aspartyl-tRNA(Asn)/glutamyl-tRNA(Gln) amidotransferase subunit C